MSTTLYQSELNNNILVSYGHIGDSIVQKNIQEEIWNLINNLYQSGFTTPYIEIQKAFPHGNDGKNYNVKYSGRDGFSFNFTTSDSYGIWGIDKMIKVEEIISLIKEEIRQSKLDHLLK